MKDRVSDKWESEKSNRLAKQKKTFARMSYFFVYFLSFVAQLRGETS